MTTTADDYIQDVIGRMPRATPLRAQIEAELRGHFAERLNRGQSIDDVVRQLGQPDALAESYLSAVPLVAASFMERVAAKLVDGVAVGAAGAAIGAVVWFAVPGLPWPLFLLFGGGAIALLLPIYTCISEYAAGLTIGKSLLGLRVVRESGARISLGQSIVRQLPTFAQVYLIDVLFALFTDNHQRAAELLSKTRVVTIG